MDEMSWGITFVLTIAMLVTVLLSMVIVQLSRTWRLKLELKAAAAREQARLPEAVSDQSS